MGCNTDSQFVTKNDLLCKVLIWTEDTVKSKIYSDSKYKDLAMLRKKLLKAMGYKLIVSKVFSNSSPIVFSGSALSMGNFGPTSLCLDFQKGFHLME